MSGRAAFRTYTHAANGFDCEFEQHLAARYVIAAISLIGAEIGREETARGSPLPPEIDGEVIRFSDVDGRAASRSYAHRPDEISRGAAP
jgi:hypothetical protein